MEPKLQVGDSARIKPFEPTIDESDISPLSAESGIKTDYRPRWQNVFSHNEVVLLNCSLEIEDTLSFGPEGAPQKGEPYWTYALEHAIQAFIIRQGLREALVAERIPFGATLVVFACGSSITIATGEDAATGCQDNKCDRCYPEDPRWAIICRMSVDGKMGMEDLAKMAPQPSGS